MLSQKHPRAATLAHASHADGCCLESFKKPRPPQSTAPPLHPIILKFSSAKAGPRKEAVRLPPHGWDVPQRQLAPGTRAHVGRPQDASAFIQVKIISGQKFQGKNSRAFSFVPVGGHQRPRGIQRDYRTACQSAIAWTREWWRSLSSEQQEELKGKHPAQTLPAEDDPLQEADAPPAKRHKA